MQVYLWLGQSYIPHFYAGIRVIRNSRRMGSTLKKFFESKSFEIRNKFRFYIWRSVISGKLFARSRTAKMSSRNSRERIASKGKFDQPYNECIITKNQIPSNSTRSLIGLSWFHFTFIYIIACVKIRCNILHIQQNCLVRHPLSFWFRTRKIYLLTNLFRHIAPVIPSGSNKQIKIDLTSYPSSLTVWRTLDCLGDLWSKSRLSISDFEGRSIRKSLEIELLKYIYRNFIVKET